MQRTKFQFFRGNRKYGGRKNMNFYGKKWWYKKMSIRNYIMK